MRALVTLLGTVLAMVLVSGQAVAQENPRAVVVIEPSSVSVTLGETFDLAVIVENPGGSDIPAAVLHIDITDLSSDSSVDPEDWTPTLSQDVGTLAPGSVESLAWSLQPISGGEFVVYAVLLVPGEPAVAVSDVSTVSVETARPLNPEGVLPVVIAGPIVTGGFLLLVLRRGSGSEAGKTG